MAQATKGSRVKVHYTGTFDDGTVFDTSVSAEPLEFIVGDGSMIQGFDTAVDGMQMGEIKNVRIPADEAYGPYDEEMVMEIDFSDWPGESKPETGVQVSLEDGEGNTHFATVKEVNGEKIVLDANHPMAGRDLNFELKLVAVE